MWPYLKWFCRNVETVSLALALNSAVNNSKYGKQLPSKHYKLLGKIPRGIARASQDLKRSRGVCTYLEHFSVPILVTRHEHKHNCSDPHFSGEGGTVYATGFFFVQSILTDRYINRRELWVVSLKSPSSAEYGIKKIFSIFVFYRELSRFKFLWTFDCFCSNFQ